MVQCFFSNCHKNRMEQGWRDVWMMKDPRHTHSDMDNFPQNQDSLIQWLMCVCLCLCLCVYVTLCVIQDDTLPRLSIFYAILFGVQH